MPNHSVIAHRYCDGKVEAQSVELANEAPLHISVNDESYVTTMRTEDGHDPELARGLLFTEGIVTERQADLRFVETIDPETKSLARLNVLIEPELLRVPVAGRRNQLASASCGICGTRDPADIELFGDPLKISSSQQIVAQQILKLFDSMNAAQTTFHESGGTHAAAAYTHNGSELAVREDIGRHNAVDKVIGHLLATNRLNDAIVLTVSGRVSYEIVTKVYRSQIPILAAVSAPSSMAVETAQAFGITLIGFCRENRMTVYTNPERITTSARSDA